MGGRSTLLRMAAPAPARWSIQAPARAIMCTVSLARRWAEGQSAAPTSTCGGQSNVGVYVNSNYDSGAGAGEGPGDLGNAWG